MAEVILSSVADGILGQLGKAAVKEIALLCDVEDELQRLGNTISTIKSVLLDAEKKQAQSEQIRTWLERLEDAVYEADDLVDEFNTEVLRRQRMTGNEIAKKVRTFFSSSNQIAFRHEMNKKIRAVRKRLDDIGNDRRFHLETGVQDSHMVIARKDEHSFEREENVIGRDEEKMEIIERLFDEKIAEEKIAVVPIVGVGGIGKTTLAKHVFNDAKVRNKFEPVMWVNVPKVFDVKSAVEQLVKPEENNKKTMDQLQQDLRQKIEQKQFLLVLDDVWDIGNREKWLELENLLRDGAIGSRIIVTTRDEIVARIINGRQELTYKLRTLNEEKAWSLFEKLAFEQGQEPDNGNLVEIGKEIMRKCGGIPLVIRTIASMLYSINLDEWSSFKEKELLMIKPYDEDVIPTLKLSYDRLPSHLKNCFGYCSLFPKNYVFNVKMLINYWMAQGFIKLSSDHNQCVEDIGYQHFKDLLNRSFFEVAEIDNESSKVTSCTMHDCMHDLAKSVTGTKGLLLSSNNEKIDDRIRHVSFNIAWDSSHRLKHFLPVHTKRIRTIICHRGFYHDYRGLRTVLKCKFLRALDLSDASLSRIPSSIDNLKHLRLLDLSYNRMKALPDSITTLENLQTLKISYCGSLRKIPSGITKLVNLRHLHAESLSGLPLCYMPAGLDQLTNLQTVSLLPGKSQSIQCIDNLQCLPDGFKNITCLEKLIIRDCSKLESLYPGLNHLTSLQLLEIESCDRLEMPNGSDTIHWQCLQSLSHLRLSNLQKLVALPFLLQQVTSLQKIEIFECKKLESVLGSISNLKLLKKLSIVDCPKLKSLPEGIGSVTTLSIRKCPILLERCVGNYWPSIFCIQELILSPVTKGDDMIFHIQKTEPEMPDSGGGGDGRQWLSVLTLRGLPGLVALPQEIQHLPSIQEIHISECENLESVVECISSMKSLKKLSVKNCPKLNSLPEGIHSLTSLVIKKCPILLDRCEADSGDYWPIISLIKELDLSPFTEEEESETFDTGSMIRGAAPG